LDWLKEWKVDAETLIARAIEGFHCPWPGGTECWPEQPMWVTKWKMKINSRFINGASNDSSPSRNGKIGWMFCAKTQTNIYWNSSSSLIHLNLLLVWQPSMQSFATLWQWTTQCSLKWTQIAFQLEKRVEMAVAHFIAEGEVGNSY
jgi:hypothetical protein